MATHLSNVVLGAGVDIDFQNLGTKGYLKNFAVHNESTPPSNPVEGQMYYDTDDNTMYYWDGAWQPFGTGGGSVTSVSAVANGGLEFNGTTAITGSIDIENLTPYGATLASGDLLAVYDIAGVTGHRKLTLGTLEAFIDHDNIQNNAGTIHTDHALVSITAGNGLTGGGTLEATRSIAVGAGDGIVVGANDINVDFTSLAADSIADADVMAFDDGVNLRKQTASSLRTYFQTGIDLTFGIAGDTGTSTVSTSQTLTVAGTSNEIETSVSGQTITVGLPDDVTIAGDLTVNGTTTTVNTDNLIVEDPLIKLGNGNTADSVDLGLYWQYDNTGNEYGGIYRDASDGNKAITFFESNTSEPTTTVTGGTLADVKFGTVRSGTWNGTVIDEAYLDTTLPRKYAADIGAGTSVVVTHGLGTNDVVCQVWDNTTDDQVFVDIDRTDANTNTVTVNFANAVSSGDYRIVVLG